MNALINMHCLIEAIKEFGMMLAFLIPTAGVIVGLCKIAEKGYEKSAAFLLALLVFIYIFAAFYVDCFQRMHK